MEHYFTNDSNTKDEVFEMDSYINDTVITFKSNNSVFSKNGVDFGSKLLIETFLSLNENSDKKLLDMGCGYGALGVSIGKFYNDLNITMCDINERAVELCKMNSTQITNNTDIFVSDLFEKVTGNFDYILTNPPIRVGKKTVFEIYEKSFSHLNEDGKLYVVIQKKQGAESSIKKITELFSNCKIVNKKSGYFILEATKQ